MNRVVFAPNAITVIPSSLTISNPPPSNLKCLHTQSRHSPPTAELSFGSPSINLVPITGDDLDLVSQTLKSLYEAIGLAGLLDDNKSIGRRVEPQKALDHLI